MQPEPELWRVPFPAALQAERFQRAQALNRRMAPFTQVDASPYLRIQLVAALTDLALEYHASVGYLMRLGRSAAGAALLRPLLELAVQAGWVLYKADWQEVEQLFTNPQRDLPQLKSMQQQLDSIPGLGTFGLRDFMSGPGKNLHLWTHGSMAQAVRRYGSTTGKRGFTAEEKNVLFATADWFLLLAMSFFEAANRPNQLASILRATASELLSEYAAETAHLQVGAWEALPDTSLPMGRTVADLTKSKDVQTPLR